ncbi:MAG: M50 family metallopeptidase [Clostridia bacterium]|nr:M50 family metallopeptidase [Clostridia bacterium]
MNKKKETKKRNIGQILVLVCFALLGVGCGLLFAKNLNGLETAGTSGGGKILKMLVILVSVCVALVLQIIIHEAGHLVFGLLTGYRFVSFRVYSFMWMKDNDRIRFKRLSIAGTGGQCLMAPPDLKDGKMPVQLYNYGGAIMNLIASAVFGGLALLCPAGSLLRPFLLMMLMTGIAYALMNGLPIKTGLANNDGRNAWDLARNPEAVRAFWISLKANELSARGVCLKDMPEEWFVVPDEKGMKNGITSSIGVFACSRLMEQGKFDEADVLMERLLSQDRGLPGVLRRMMVCDRIYVELIRENRPEVLENLRTKDQEKFMKAMKKFPSVLRTEYAYALLVEKDPGKAQEVMETFDKTARTYPNPNDIEIERGLMETAREAAAV